jgi:hypothetical protein
VELERRYDEVRFAAEVIEEAHKLVRELGGDLDKAGLRTLVRGADTWRFDSNTEWLSEYRGGFTRAVHTVPGRVGMEFAAYARHTTVTATAPTREEVLRLLNVFDRRVDESRLPPVPSPPPPPPPPPPVIFIGHGKSSDWRDLKDHLHEQHGFNVEAYETGARAGHTIRDVLEGMAGRATFAILVMTGEDLVGSAEDADPQLRARQNVVHEVGLFQGSLGWDRAIVAIEEGVEPFSNLQGVNQLRFGKGKIKEVFGDVLATLRREFPPR